MSALIPVIVDLVDGDVIELHNRFAVSDTYERPEEFTTPTEIVLAHCDAEQLARLPIDEDVAGLVWDLLGDRALTAARTGQYEFLAAVNPAGRRRY